MSENLSPAAVVIGTLRVKVCMTDRQTDRQEDGGLKIVRLLTSGINI